MSLLFCVLVFDFITYVNQFFTLSSGRFYCLKILNFTGFSVTFSPYNLCYIEATLKESFRKISAGITIKTRLMAETQPSIISYVVAVRIWEL